MNGVLVENLVLNAPLHLIAHYGIAARGVHHDAAGGFHFLLAHRVLHTGMVRIAEIHAGHADSFVNLSAEFVGMLKQHQVEFAAIHVVCVVLTHALFALGEADVHMAIRRDSAEIHVVNFGVGSSGPGRTQLVWELRFFHLRQEIKVLEDAS